MATNVLERKKSTHADQVASVVQAVAPLKEQYDHLIADLAREKDAAGVDDLVAELREREVELEGASALDRALGKIELQTARDELAAELSRRRQRLDIVTEAYGSELRTAHEAVKRSAIAAIAEQSAPRWVEIFQHLDTAMRELDDLMRFEQDANAESGGFLSGPASPALRLLRDLAPRWDVARNAAHPELPPRAGGMSLAEWRALTGRAA
jgi:hypothetical protein